MKRTVAINRLSITLPKPSVFTKTKVTKRPCGNVLKIISIRSGVIRHASKQTLPVTRKNLRDRNTLPSREPPKMKKKKTMKQPVG